MEAAQAGLYYCGQSQNRTNYGYTIGQYVQECFNISQVVDPDRTGSVDALNYSTFHSLRRNCAVCGTLHNRSGAEGVTGRGYGDSSSCSLLGRTKAAQGISVCQSGRFVVLSVLPARPVLLDAPALIVALIFQYHSGS